QTRYLNVREDMIEWDIDRFSENLNITRIEQPSSYSNYTYDILVKNEGGVLINVERIYVFDNETQEMEVLDKQVNSSVKGYNGTSGVIIQGEGNHPVFINASAELNSTPYERYRIVLCTERGRQFSYIYPPTPFETNSSYYGEYPLVISDDYDNFQYTAGLMTEFESAFVKPRGTDRTLYRLLLNNTTDKRIYLWENTTMLQMQGAVGAITEKFIVSSNSSSNPDNLVAYSNQSIEARSEGYIYFAAATVGGNTWQTESDKKDYHIVGWILWFKYEGETEIKNVSLFSIIQKLTD
ncbi:MAG: hypothetical protein NWE86_01005, partial [Candidatus Bathyarchaeota archaeon]|nr:hypothetical protein [Candidatus Bathyarchaeota archaeon]